MKNQNRNIKNVIHKLLLYVRQKEIVASRSEKEELWDNITTDVNKLTHKKIKRRRLYIASSAVAVALILVVMVFRFMVDSDSDYSLAQMALNKQVTGDTDDILLVVSEDKKMEIKDESDIIYKKDGSIVVDSENIDKAIDNDKQKEIEYNQLIVPKGKRTMIMLADETKMWVNSGSRVLYPRSFTQKTRKIYVEGEVYLEVAHNEKQPFIVETKTFEVQVFGTSFNVCSYEGISTSSVVLVDGMVNVKDSRDNKSRLQPNQLITIDNDGLGNIKEVAAIDYISWTQGLFTLHAESFGMVLNKLSQYYGVKIEMDNIDKNIPITGKLVLKNDFLEVLDGLCAIVPITYTSQDGIYRVKIKD